MQRTPGEGVSSATAVVETHGLGERYGAIDASGASAARSSDRRADLPPHLTGVAMTRSTACVLRLGIVVFALTRGGPDEYLTLDMAFVPGFLDEITDSLDARFVADAR